MDQGIIDPAGNRKDRPAYLCHPAFYFNWGDIAGSVIANPGLLMVLGAIVALAFCISLWGILTAKEWAVNLVIGLAVFDIIGEFVAQGTLAIEITISFIVAVVLLVVALQYRRRGV